MRDGALTDPGETCTFPACNCKPSWWPAKSDAVCGRGLANGLEAAGSEEAARKAMDEAFCDWYRKEFGLRAPFIIHRSNLYLAFAAGVEFGRQGEGR